MGCNRRVCSVVGIIPILRDEDGRIVTRSGLVVSLQLLSQARLQTCLAMPGRTLQAVAGALTVWRKWDVSA